MQQPIKVSNLSVTPSGTISFNKGTTIQELPSHSMPFQFVKQQSLHTTAISTLTKSTSGTFNVYGAIKWKGEAHVPSKKATKQVCNTILTDNTGSIPMSLWGDQITTVQEGEFYTFTECKLSFLWQVFNNYKSNNRVYSSKTGYQQSSAARSANLDSLPGHFKHCCQFSF